MKASYHFTQGWKWEQKREHVQNVVVIDVYAATTNINIILSKSPKKFFIINKDNLASAKEKYPSSILLGESSAISNFDVSNEPSEIDRADLKDKIVLYMSENGTKAFEKYAGVDNLIACSFNNISAVTKYLNVQENKNVHMEMSGSTGKPVLEDKLCADMLAEKLQGKPVDWQAYKSRVLDFVTEFVDYQGYFRSPEQITFLDKYDFVPKARKTKNGWLGITEH